MPNNLILVGKPEAHKQACANPICSIDDVGALFSRTGCSNRLLRAQLANELPSEAVDVEGLTSGSERRCALDDDGAHACSVQLHSDDWPAIPEPEMSTRAGIAAVSRLGERERSKRRKKMAR